MIFIDKNKRNDSSIFDVMKIIVQTIVNNFYFFIERYVLKFSAIHLLNFFFENIKHEYDLKNIDRLFSIHLNRKYDENKKIQQNFENEYFIRKFLIDNEIRFVRFINQIKIKLKIKYFDKNYLIEIFDKSHIFLFCFLFVDNFDIYKNMYKLLKTFYFIFACLSYKKNEKSSTILF